MIKLHHGDCRAVLRELADNSIDSVVTDPPYALVSIVKRFGSPDAAPVNGNDVYTRASAGFMGKRWDTGETAFDPGFWADVLRVVKPGGHVAAFGASRGYHRMACAIEDAGFEIRDSLMWVYGTGFPKSHNMNGKWEGWGTALKPAFEPIVLARKPLSENTVAANVLLWGTGALNIGACRVEGEPVRKNTARGGGYSGGFEDITHGTGTTMHAEGRWPANVVHDGSDEVIAAFPTAGGQQGRAKIGGTKAGNIYGKFVENISSNPEPRGDSGSAARFFYSAKASKADRAGSKHPTVKPPALGEWLAKLITPPGGIVLDPFAGSGGLAAGARQAGFRVVMCEREDEYAADIRRRFGLMPWE